MFTRLLQSAKTDCCSSDSGFTTAPSGDDVVNFTRIRDTVEGGIQFPRHYNAVREYWKALGLSNFPYTRPLLLDRVCFEDDVETAYHYVKTHNVQFFNHITDPVACSVWDVDGLCATGKTSVMSDIRKSNNHLNMIGQNLHLSSALGYVFSSLKMMRDNPHTTWDRTPFNNVNPWFYSWLLLAHVHLHYDEQYRGVYKNVYYNNENPLDDTYFEEVLSDSVLTVWREHATAIHPHTRSALGRLCKHIIVVDSNERGATERLRKRALGSDVERSFWPHYMRVQNYMYAHMALLDPKHYCVIDLNTFDGDQPLMQAVIRTIMTRHRPVSDERQFAFKPLSATLAKPYLMQQHEEYERTRPLQVWQFTNDTKLFIDECTRNREEFLDTFDSDEEDESVAVMVVAADVDIAEQSRTNSVDDDDDLTEESDTSYVALEREE